MLDDIFEKLTGVPFICNELELNDHSDYQRVAKWRKTGRVPPKFRGRFMDMCKKYNVEVTLKQLAGEE